MTILRRPLSPPKIDKYPFGKETKLWALVSGGKDSMVLADWLRHAVPDRGDEWIGLAGVLHIDTGIGTPDLIPFLKQQFFDLEEGFVIIRTPIEYDWFVRKYGFPGPAGHRYAVNYLKGRAIRQFRKSHPEAILASGVRRHESVRRMGTSKKWSKFEGLWCHAPLFDWTTEQVWKYIHDKHIEVSPAYWNLHISGDCLCGSFARPEEIYLIETFYPEIAKRIRGLERERDGKPRCRWGNGEGFGKQSRLETYLCQGCEMQAQVALR